VDLVTARIVTATVESLTGFYAALLEIDTGANDYYVEVPTGAATLAVCRRRFTEADGCGTQPTFLPEDRVILDFEVADRDPDGNVVNVFSRQGRGG